MKRAAILLLAVAGCSAFVPLLKQQHIDTLGSKQIAPELEALTGKALEEYLNANQKFFTAKDSGLTADEMRAKVMDKKYLEKLVNEVIVAPEIKISEDAGIPDSFDSRQQWANCATINDIRDQSDCGSCWAFAAAEAMSDGICIASKGATTVRISSQDLLSCCGAECGNGCDGGYPIRAWKYFKSKGLCTGWNYGDTTTCKPYTLAPCGSTGQPSCPKNGYTTPSCTSSCIPQYTAHTYANDKHMGASAYAVQKLVSSIQKEIMTYGPVEAAFTVYEDFYQYTGGVYVHTAGKEVGGHAVKIIGWGEDNGTPYWLIANSWGNTWGEQGFFRILRGSDECGIEDGIVAGHAQV